MLKKIRKIDAHATLYRDNRTGIAFMEDSSRGCSWTVHPSISNTGSVQQMKALGFWERDDKIIPCESYYINTSHLIIEDGYDEILAEECNCPSCIARREKEAEAAKDGAVVCPRYRGKS